MNISMMVKSAVVAAAVVFSGAAVAQQDAVSVAQAQCSAMGEVAGIAVSLRNADWTKQEALQVLQSASDDSNGNTFFVSVINAVYSVQGRGVAKSEMINAVARSCMTVKLSK